LNSVIFCPRLAFSWAMPSWKLRFIPSMVVCCSGVYAETSPARRTKTIIIMPLITSHPLLFL
jgi:hypothetical protein